MDPSYPHMPAEAARHISGFIRRFVEPRKRGRWRTVLAMKPEKWRSVSASDCLVEPVAAPNTPPGETLSSHGLASEIDTDAWVFPLGHGAGEGAWEGSLRAALADRAKTDK